MALFWPELDQAHARGALRQALHHLRRALGPEILLTRGDQEVAIDGSRLWCDAIAFEAQVERGELAAALDLYRGSLLPGFHLSGCAELERWLEEERDRLSRCAVTAAATLVRSREAAGDLGAATRFARRALELAPYDEVAARSLVDLLSRTGARAEAIEVYGAFAKRLAEDMGLPVSPEMEALVRSIRAPVGAAPRGAHEPAPHGSGREPESEVLVPRRLDDKDSPTAPAAVADLDATAGRPPAGGTDPVVQVHAPARHIGDGRRHRWPRTVTLALIGLAGASFALARWGVGDGRARVVPSRVAVMPFAVAGSGELAYLRDGLADLLSTNLDGAGELRAVDPNVILAHLPPDRRNEIDPARARAIAAHFGAGLYVLGSMIEAGSRLRVRASLYDAAGTLRGTAEATVDEEGRLFDLVDELARQLVVLSPVQPPERLARIGAVTTESFPALKAYLEGERLLRAGRYDSAVSAYERSIASDSGFALAYYRTAVARHLDATPSGSPDAHRRALAFADRLAPRDRLLLQAFDAFQRHQDREAERLYREALSVHPEEVEAWVFLGEVIAYYGLWRGRPIADARRAFERALALDSSHVSALKDLSWVAAMEERFDEVAALTERVLALQSDTYYGPAARLQLALARRDRAAEATALDELRAMESAYIHWSQRWAHFSGNLEGRLRVARLLTEPRHPDVFRRRGHIVSSRYLLDRGRWADALSELTPLERLEPDAYYWAWSRYHMRPLAPASPATLENVAARVESWVPSSREYRLARLYTLGVIRARLRDSAGAEVRALELDAHATQLGRLPQFRREAALAHALALGVRAWQAAEAGRPHKSLEYLDRLRPEEWWQRAQSGGVDIDAIQSWLRAEVLSRLGREREALHLYAPLGFLWGDAGTLAPKHLRMGEIHERLGDRERAVRHYRRFVEIWRECDPELRPLLREVEGRIARLSRR